MIPEWAEQPAFVSVSQEELQALREQAASDGRGLGQREFPGQDWGDNVDPTPSIYRAVAEQQASSIDVALNRALHPLARRLHLASEAGRAAQTDAQVAERDIEEVEELLSGLQQEHGLMALRRDFPKRLYQRLRVAFVLGDATALFIAQQGQGAGHPENAIIASAFGAAAVGLASAVGTLLQKRSDSSQTHARRVESPLIALGALLLAGALGWAVPALRQNYLQTVYAEGELVPLPPIVFGLIHLVVVCATALLSYLATNRLADLADELQARRHAAGEALAAARHVEAEAKAAELTALDHAALLRREAAAARKQWRWFAVELRSIERLNLVLGRESPTDHPLVAPRARPRLRPVPPPRAAGAGSGDSS